MDEPLIKRSRIWVRDEKLALLGKVPQRASQCVRSNTSASDALETSVQSVEDELGTAIAASADNGCNSSCTAVGAQVPVRMVALEILHLLDNALHVQGAEDNGHVGLSRLRSFHITLTLRVPIALILLVFGEPVHQE